MRPSLCSRASVCDGTACFLWNDLFQAVIQDRNCHCSLNCRTRNQDHIPASPGSGSVSLDTEKLAEKMAKLPFTQRAQLMPCLELSST